VTANNGSGRVAVLTGAGSGIGRATALRLAADGYRVALLGRRAHALKETAAEVDGDDRTLVLSCDVTDHALVAATVARVVDTFGRIDVVVNNASISATAPSDLEQVERFTGALADLNSGIKADAVSGYRLPEGGTVVDIGGADGALLLQLLAADPDDARHRVVFDLPHVVPAAQIRLADHPLRDRVEVVACNFFDTVPAGDLYVLDDPARLERRGVCADLAVGRCGGPAGGTVDLAGAGRAARRHAAHEHDDRFGDAGMLTGRERSEAELTALFTEAGMRLDRVVPSHGPMSVVEVTVS
jgi:hypothetical protein